MKFYPKKRSAIEAWKYVPNEPIPAWVARRCHFLGDGKFTANTIAGRVPIELGDYVVLLSEPGEDVMVAAVTGTNFEAEYEPAEGN